VHGQFRVDLRGIVNVLSHHLYSSERVYLRELVQNAHDAIRARSALEDDVRGAIEIEPAWGTGPLVVRDNGIGLTRTDMDDLLAIIGSTSKKDDFAAARRHLLGQFGIGLLSCFLVADSIEVVSRSAREPDAPTLRWEGRAGGTFTIGEAAAPLPRPGTEVRLRPRHGARRWCDVETCEQIARDVAGLLEVPVTVAGTLVSQQQPPWELSTEEQLDWCREQFGFDAMGIIPLDSLSGDIVGLAFVLPYTARPGYRTGDRIYAKRMLVADTDDLIVPRWAFFCRAVIDAGDLPLTASREGLQESSALQYVRKQIGFRLLTELILVQGQHPDVFREIVTLHADGLKALAVSEPDVRDLLRSAMPYTTTLGERTIAELLKIPGPIPYIGDGDAFDALGDVAARAGVLMVKASGLHEAELLEIIGREEGDGHFRAVDAQDVVDLADPTPYPDIELAARLIAKAGRALRGEDVFVQVASFEPSERPVLWWPVPAAEPGRAGWGGHRATLILNSANGAVKHLIEAPAQADLSSALRALYVTGLLLGGARPGRAQTGILSQGVQDLIETTCPTHAQDG
jgi:molecular chaperone HtpG